MFPRDCQFRVQFCCRKRAINYLRAEVIASSDDYQPVIARLVESNSAELIALTGDFRVARAAFDEAVKGRPGRIVTLRQKTARRLNFTGRVAVLSVRLVRVPSRSRTLRPCQAPRNCNPNQICTKARFSYRKPRQAQLQPSPDSRQPVHLERRMPRIKVPTEDEDNGPCDFLRGQTRGSSTIAADLLFLRRLRSAPF